MDEYYTANGEFNISGLLYSKFREKLPLISGRILEGSRKIARIIKELKEYSNTDEIQTLDRVDLNKVLKSALILLENMIKKTTQNLTQNLAEKIPPVLGNFQRFEQIMVNIIQNACQAVSDETKAIRISSFYDKRTDKVIIRCEDEGIGIPVENLPRIFDPFFTTKRGTGGIGLGLSISSSIAREFKGDINIESRKSGGTIVTIKFPVVTNHDKNNMV